MAATRRVLLAAAGCAALPAQRGFPGDEPTRQGRHLKGLLRGSHSAHLVAAAYMAGIGRTDMRRAAQDLDMRSVLAPLDLSGSPAASRAWLGARIRADFAEGAVIDVDGWRLSRTEVGACLLVADAA
jgi:hypothetical protein